MSTDIGGVASVFGEVGVHTMLTNPKADAAGSRPCSKPFFIAEVVLGGDKNLQGGYIYFEHAATLAGPWNKIHITSASTFLGHTTVPSSGHLRVRFRKGAGTPCDFVARIWQ